MYLCKYYVCVCVYVYMYVCMYILISNSAYVAAMSTHSRTSSRDSRRSRSSTESRISMYSDDELLAELRRRGLQSTGESRRYDEDRQSSESRSRQNDEEHQRS